MDAPLQSAEEDLATTIRKTAARARARDFSWAVGISAGLGAVMFVVTRLDLLPRIADWQIPLLIFVTFLFALAVRYNFSSGRLWAEPVQRVIDAEISAREAELTTLRLARGVAQVLPDPLFILDTEGMIELANPAAEGFVGGQALEGRHIAAALRAPSVFEAVEGVAAGSAALSVDFTTTGGVERSCRAFVAPFSDGKASRRVLVFIRDLTSERRLEQMRADFIASASHELRTPLSSVIGFIETLRGPAKGDPEASERFLAIMQGQAERMQRLVADLMSLSRIELHEHVPPNETANVRELALEVIEGLQPLLEQSGAIVDFEEEAGGAFDILGDKDEIIQAIQNLIDNALKYGGDPALVKVRVGRGAAPTLAAEGEITHRAGDSALQTAARRMIDPAELVYVQVRDFGPGIERADLPRLTERFYRVNIQHSRKSGGTGLGLAIVKHIVNRHMGGLQIESRPAGGTAFTCYFRALAAAPGTRAAS